MKVLRSRRAYAIALSLCLAVTAAGAAEAPSSEAWDLLVSLRGELSSNGPLVANFEQTYVPAGFESGEQEGGTLAIALPDCLRWDYTWPFAKTYLLCGGQVHAWNPGEMSGRRYVLDPEEAPGLDLLMLGIDDLRERYQATLLAAEGELARVHLVPSEPTAALDSATFTIDTRGPRLVALEWTDTAENRTRFELSNLRPLGRLELFSPPMDLEWISN